MKQKWMLKCLQRSGTKRRIPLKQHAHKIDKLVAITTQNRLQIPSRRIQYPHIPRFQPHRTLTIVIMNSIARCLQQHRRHFSNNGGNRSKQRAHGIVVEEKRVREQLGSNATQRPNVNSFVKIDPQNDLRSSVGTRLDVERMGRRLEEIGGKVGTAKIDKLDERSR